METMTALVNTSQAKGEQQKQLLEGTRWESSSGTFQQISTQA